MLILIILLNKIVQLSLLHICGIFYAEFGGVIHFAVKVWSSKLCQIKGFIGVSRCDQRFDQESQNKTSRDVTAMMFLF